MCLPRAKRTVASICSFMPCLSLFQITAAIVGVGRTPYVAAAYELIDEQAGRRFADTQLAAELADGDAQAAIDDDQSLELCHRQVEPQQGRQAELMQAGVDGPQVFDDVLDARVSIVHVSLAG